MGKLLTAFNKDVIDNFISAVGNTSLSYYVFASRPFSFTDDNNPPSAFESNQEALFTPMDGLMFAKKIRQADIGYLVKRHDWSSNTVYSQYDHSDIDLFSKTFFVITDQNKVYKVLSNNRGAASTVKPTLTQNTAFTTSDGYLWKYMFTVSAQDYSNYTTNEYIPITANTLVQTSATEKIETIHVIAGGNGYITSTNGVVQSVNGAIVQLQNNSRPDNHFYDDCTFYVSSGSAAGQIRRIANYVVNNSGNWVVLDTNITGLSPSTTTYEIAPRVIITGDGSNATAISRVSNGVIGSVVMINNGNNYTRATVSLAANTSYGGGANLYASIAPLGGHGSKPFNELGGDAMGITVNFANNEASTIPTEVTFRTVGILKNPKSLANTANLVSTNTFSQVFVCNTTPATTFTTGNYVIGANSGAKGWIAFSNSSTLYLTGDQDFNAGEGILQYYANGTATSVNCAINTIASKGAIDTTTPEIMYLSHYSPVPRSSATTETIKLVIKT